MTLVEVVAGLALLGSLLVGTLLAKAKHTRQIGEAQQRLEAIAAADHLMAGWWANPASLPRNSAGAVDGSANLAWRTLLVAGDEVKQFGASAVRLEILSQDDGQRSPAVLASVEFLVPDPPTHPARPEGGKW